MKRMPSFIIPLFLSNVLLSLCLVKETKQRSLESIEFFSGFGKGKLREREDYNLVPLMIDLDFNLKALLARKLNFNPPQLLQFQIEPFISLVSSPDTNVETGTAFFFKAGILPQTSKLQPYIKAGLGMVYITQQTREQSTQFNFIEQGVIGLHYFLKRMLLLQWRAGLDIFLTSG